MLLKKRLNAFSVLALLALLALPPSFGQGLPGLPCADHDRNCARQALRNHVAGRIETWQATASIPVGERIGAAPPPLVEYVNLDNILNGFPERPRAAQVDAGLLADVKGAMADLPSAIWTLAGDRLLGIYFVEDLGGTGYTDYILDRSGKPVGAFIVFDAAVLARKKANAWATWKESTPFKNDSFHVLAARIEADGDDNRKNAIQYILLHELGHVLSVGTTLHPPWSIEPREVEAGATYPYFDLSWQVDRQANKYRSRFDASFPQRARTVYYFGAKLAADEMLTTYGNLENTNFSSLYAATSPGDDFAEAFASYVHVVLMQRPWQISISRDGKLVKVFKACWGEPRCAKKQEMLRRFVERPSR